MRLTRWSNYVASTWLNGCSAFYSDWDIAARLFFPARRKSLERNWSKRSWAREQITAQLVPTAAKPVTAHRILEQGHAARFLIVPANVYCDGRLLAALSARNSPTVLVDSNPPQFFQDMIQNPSGPALVTRDFLLACSDSAPVFEELKQKTETREIDTVDAAKVDDYIVSMRRRVRPLCFSAPPEQSRRVAERVILDSAQNGTLDLPAYIHGPIENGNHLASLQNANHAKPNYDCEVSSLDAAQPRHSRLAVSGSESSLLSYWASSMDWMESSRVSKSKRPSAVNGNIISII